MQKRNSTKPTSNSKSPGIQSNKKQIPNSPEANTTTVGGTTVSPKVNPVGFKTTTATKQNISIQPKTAQAKQQLKQSQSGQNNSQGPDNNLPTIGDKNNGKMVFQQTLTNLKKQGGSTESISKDNSSQNQQKVGEEGVTPTSQVNKKGDGMQTPTGAIDQKTLDQQWQITVEAVDHKDGKDARVYSDVLDPQRENTQSAQSALDRNSLAIAKQNDSDQSMFLQKGEGKSRDYGKLNMISMREAEKLDKKYSVFRFKGMKTQRLVRKSLFFCGQDNPIRILSVYLTYSPYFDNFIIIMILLNSLLLASYDYSDRLNERQYNQTVNFIDKIFSIIFIVECTLKIIANGFIIGKKTYIRNPWNILDFFVVLISIAELIPGISTNQSLKGLRTARILRPLRSIKSLPSMQKLIHTLLASLKNLLNVVVFLLFVFILFGIFGLNSFQGQLYSRCRLTDEPYLNEFDELIWPINYDVPLLCTQETDDNICLDYPNQFGEPSVCGHPSMYNMTLATEDVEDQELISYGIVGFDNLPMSLISIFQILTLEGWTDMMYNYMDVNKQNFLVVSYFCLVVLFGSFFVMNLILAAIMDSFDQNQNDNVNLDDDAVRRSESVSMISQLGYESVSKKKYQDSFNTDKSMQDFRNSNNNSQAVLQQVQSNSSNHQVNDSVSSLKQLLQNAKVSAKSPIIVEDQIGEHSQKKETDQLFGMFDNNQQHQKEQIAMTPQEDQEIQQALDDVGKKSPFDILQQLTSAKKKPGVNNEIITESDNGGEKAIPTFHRQDLLNIDKHDSKQVKTNRITNFDETSKSLSSQLSDALPKSAFQQFVHYLWEDPDGVKVPPRANQNAIYYFLYKLSMSRVFNTVIFVFIILNTVVLAMDKYPLDEEQEETLKNYNTFFTWVFTLEMVIKLIGLGPKAYSQSSFNLFDGFVVIINLVDIVISNSLSQEGLSEASGAIQSFRCLRLLRVGKLAKSWPALQRIIINTAKSLKDIANFSLLLFIFIFIFALLGMELFAFKVRFDKEGSLIPVVDGIIYEGSVSPRANFDTFFHAFQAIFIVIIGEDWNSVMYQQERSQGLVAKIYFIVLLVFGNFILLSLFTAILLKNFESDTEEESKQILAEKENERKSAAHKKALANTLHKIIDGVISNDDDPYIQSQKKDKKLTKGQTSPELTLQKIDPETARSESQKKDEKQDENKNVTEKKSLDLDRLDRKLTMSLKKQSTLNKTIKDKKKLNDNYNLTEFHKAGSQSSIKKAKLQPLEGRSLYIFSASNPIRQALMQLIVHPYFDFLILTLIFISTVFLAMDNPLNNPEGALQIFLAKADFILLICFVVELIVKVIANGFLFNGPGSYLKLGWNQLDFFIVVASIVTLVLQNQNLKFIKAIRIFRVLRPLRVIQRNKGLRISVMSMLNSIPDIINLELIVLFVFFLMGILGTTFFKGRLFYCDTSMILEENTLEQITLLQELDFTKWQCLSFGGEWLKYELNFDNALVSVRTLFILQSTEGWVDLLWTGIDAYKIDYNPIRDYNPGAFFFFMASVILFSLFFLNLFVGVVIDTFKREKDILSKNNELNADQREWISIYTMILSSSPQIKFKNTGNQVVDKCRYIAQHKYFEYFILSCIMLNTFVLTLSWYGQSEEISNVNTQINYYFNVIFTIEAVIKLIGQKYLYFRDGWNLFDFFVVVGTWVIILISNISGSEGVGAQGTLLRTFRIGRVFRIVKGFKDLKVIFNTLIVTLPSLASVGGLLMLLFFLYAIMGTFLFSTVMLNNSLDTHANFQTFGTAFLLLFRMSTGESWFQIMFDCSRSYSIMYQCEQNVDYYTIMENGGNVNGCGSPITALFYFVTFQIIVSQIFLNLFIAIIIEAFGDQNEIESMALNDMDIQEFQDCWKEFDPNATGFIKVEDFEPLIIALCKTKSDIIPIKNIILRYNRPRKQIMIKMKNPTYKNFRYYQYYQTLKKLAEHNCELKFTRSKINVAKNIISEQIENEGHDIKDNFFQKMMQKKLNIMVAVQEDDDFQVFLSEIAEADPDIELVEKMLNKRHSAFKKSGKYLDYKYNQIYDSAHQILVPLIQNHVKKNILKESDDVFGDKKPIASTLGLTAEGDNITKATSLMSNNTNQLVSQLSLPQSINSSNQKRNQFKRGNSHDIHLQVNYSPQNQNGKMSPQDQSSKNQLSPDMNSSNGKQLGRLPTINSQKSGEDDKNDSSNNNYKNSLSKNKNDIISEEDSLIDELNGEQYKSLDKDQSLNTSSIANNAKVQPKSLNQSISNKQRTTSNNKQPNDNLDSMIRDAGLEEDSI